MLNLIKRNEMSTSPHINDTSFTIQFPQHLRSLKAHATCSGSKMNQCAQNICYELSLLACCMENMSYLPRGRPDRDHMVVGFATTYSISDYHH